MTSVVATVPEHNDDTATAVDAHMTDRAESEVVGAADNA